MESELASPRQSAATMARRTSAQEQIEAILVQTVARSFRVRPAALTAPGRTAAREALARHVVESFRDLTRSGHAGIDVESFSEVAAE